MSNFAKKNPAAVAIGGTVLTVIAAVWLAYAATARAQEAPPDCPDMGADLARIADAIERIADVAESTRPQPRRPYQCGPVGADGKRVCEPMPDGWQPWEPMPDGWRPW